MIYSSAFNTITCDSPTCPVKKTYADTTKIEVAALAETEGWTVQERRTLCPTCSKRYERRGWL